ncbi:ArsR/SmtB family transcription factor [Longispora albida]|uniref:ArsR/SmtB family transcription factor n=1 Tax=Longispora albida TaxID=203523 RepID=UPI0003732D47|nr:helix-turn-helix domain-containing protein [Longispora albida]
MSEVRFGAGDVARVRFAISPRWETVASLGALAEPGRHPSHGPWLREARALAADPELRRLVAPVRALIGPGMVLPDFLTPPPSEPLADLDAELAGLPAELSAGIRAWWAAAIAPHWSRIRAVLEADIAYRTRQLAEGGLSLLFDRLHPTVRWAGDRLVAQDCGIGDLDLAGRGLPLLPSVFAPQAVLLSTEPAAPPVAIYPARGSGLLWTSGPVAPGLAKLLGRSRAEVLALTVTPSSTSQVAERAGLSLPAASQQLTVLREAGLITSRRYRREVLHATTELGAALLHP